MQERPFAVGAGGLALGLGLLTSRLLADDSPTASRRSGHGKSTPNKSGTRTARRAAKRDEPSDNSAKPSTGSTRRAPRSAALAGGVSDAAVRAGREAQAGRPAERRGGKRDDGKRVGTGRGPGGNDTKDRSTATAPPRSRRPTRKPSSRTRTPSTEPTNDR